MLIKRNVSMAAALSTLTSIASLVSPVAVPIAAALAPAMDIPLNIASSPINAASPAGMPSSMDATDVTSKSLPIAATLLPPMDILSNVASSPMGATSPTDLSSLMDAADTTSKSKPKRPCVYCGKFQTKLRRHLVLIHSSEVAVSNAMKQVSKRDKDNAFNSIKKNGILEENKKVIKSGTGALLCERNQEKLSNEQMVMCGHCKGFYAKAYFFGHRQTCSEAEASSTVRVSVPMLLVEKYNENDSFVKEVVARFTQDVVGKLCQTNDTIILFGRRQYQKLHRKNSKEAEVRKSTMRDMRRVGTLYIAFCDEGLIQNISGLICEDLVNRKYFSLLESAIKKTTVSEDELELKAGLKLCLGYVIKRLAKVLKAQYLIDDKDIMAQSVDNFLTVLEIQWPYVFGDAESKVVIKRQEKLRKPAHLAPEEELVKLREHTQLVLEGYTKKKTEYNFWNATEYTKLRNYTCSRLTLFNARRGGEPARLLRKEWTDAMNNAWIDSNAVQAIDDPIERSLLGKLKVAYLAGKGSRQLVPLLIPNDCLAALELLNNPEVREQAGVNSKNLFVFPSLQLSLDHTNGWLCTKYVCENAGISCGITATQLRHRASTYYASLEVSQEERVLFYSHMGHSETTNMNIYQCPPAVHEITKIGRLLDNLDSHKGSEISRDLFSFLQYSR